MDMKAARKISNATQEFLDNKREYVLSHSGTKHPFLISYEKNGLTSEATKKCYLELFQFINSYPFYLAILAGRIGDLSVLQEMVRILSDEVGARPGHRPHLHILSFP